MDSQGTSPVTPCLANAAGVLLGGEGHGGPPFGSGAAAVAPVYPRHGLGTEEPGRQRPHRRRDQAHHLTDAVAALDLELTDDEVRSLQEPYAPRLPTYF